MTTTLQTAGEATGYLSKIERIVAEQAVEIEKLKGHIKHIGNDALRSEVEKLRKDAERYRWLRRGDNDEKVLVIGKYQSYLPRNEKLDELIDAAIQKETP